MLAINVMMLIINYKTFVVGRWTSESLRICCEEYFDDDYVFRF